MSIFCLRIPESEPLWGGMYLCDWKDSSDVDGLKRVTLESLEDVGSQYNVGWEKFEVVEFKDDTYTDIINVYNMSDLVGVVHG